MNNLPGNWTIEEKSELKGLPDYVVASSAIGGGYIKLIVRSHPYSHGVYSTESDNGFGGKHYLLGTKDLNEAIQIAENRFKGWVISNKQYFEYLENVLFALGTGAFNYANCCNDFNNGVDEAIDEVKQLCQDYSARNGSVFIGDVMATLDSLKDRILKQET